VDACEADTRSQIHLPRDSGCCTRCPFEVRLRSSSLDWSCRISLRRSGDDEKAAEEPFGSEITDPAQVEDRLRRAQFSLRNPSQDARKFLELDDEVLKQANKSKDGLFEGQKMIAFTKNVVCVDISGPGIVDLAFLDLPVTSLLLKVLIR
jgi:hypothetical protein